MRACAKLLHVNRITVERKLAYLAKKANISQKKFLEQQRGQVAHLQFDDMITSEHTKMRPLTITLAVDARRRFILGAQVEQIGAFGHLAKLSRAKYGPRPNRHDRSLEELFRKISPAIALGAKIESDEHTRYPPVVAKWLPGRPYERYIGGRGAIVGQGELKRKRYDPLFILNHTCAMFRAGVNRLIRKTWCTTKRPERLQQHLDLFIDWYNQDYLRG